MLIAQITDIHIGFDKASAEEHNLLRLRGTIATLCASADRPDLLLLTGDLTEDGAAEDYARLVAELAPCPFPVWPLVGNHDRRDELRAAFPQVPPAPDGFVHYVLDEGPLRVIVLDTLEPGRHGGSFCAERAAWLSGRLAEAPARPTLVALHHPPFASGIPWMDTVPGEPWVARLAACLAGQDQVVGLVCGHVHRTILSRWAGLPTLVCPSTAPAVGLELAPIDPDCPDGRRLITDEPPGYALHRWTGGELVSHFGAIGPWLTLARYEEQLQPMIRAMLDERPAG